MHQSQYIRETIERLNTERGGFSEAFAKEAREIDAAIEALILSSNNGPQVVALRMKKEDVRRTLTARAAAVGGQVEALTEVFNRYHQNPVAPGTVVHGIDVSVLDWETRAKIMSGDPDTVAAFGGTLAPPHVAEPTPTPATTEPTPAPEQAVSDSVPSVKRKVPVRNQ